ncbi:hypothetical protein C8F04DRAFT_1002511 [Mycena alexandri]|uniref:CxC5 like cysteine cluster associated with KDZ domain-containing protein n=1 Tax=Mycena alexandri TaxID=1745969 RepID=A0AAD6SXM8_9AGAR|nr:hypothetical protein C8F04DRAFT_1002511 [Mycena alexandri]
MSDHDASDATPEPEGISLAQTLLFTRLLAVLKRDIILVQPVSSGAEEAPLILSPSIVEFVAEAVGIPEPYVPKFWALFKDDIWGLPEQVLGEHEEELFRKYGWKRGITALTMYPPSHYCTNVNCRRDKHLTNAQSRQVVVYTVSNGVVPAHEVQLYCRDCNTTYYPNFSVQHGIRTYYAGIPSYIQVGGHQYVAKKQVASWTALMLVAHVSATNCSRAYDMALSGQEERDFSDGGWQFGSVLTTDHVWDAFTILTLLDYHDRLDTLLQVPHSGNQKDRFTAAMTARNVEVIVRGQDVVGHVCDKCTRSWTLPDGTPYDVQSVLCDGLAMGHVRCQYPHCTKYLNSNRDRFCPDHAALEKICSIVGCERPATEGKKSCDDPRHADIERLHYERGKAAFTLRDRLNRHHLAHPSGGEDPEALTGEEDIEWFEVGEDGSIGVHAMEDPGSVGTLDTDCEANKSDEGNRRYKALFGRCRTHNEQLLVWPCGVIFARTTFYHAEAVSNVLLFVQKAFSVPGARKPAHLIYDTNCDAKQQVVANPHLWGWFHDVGMTVDVFHFLNKHSVTHVFCQANCNPAAFPELMNADGTGWFFNTSVAEQTNAWFGGYASICREMLPVKYNFFLDEMIRLRNQKTLAKLAADGHNPRIVLS